jgi:hypothetical protein
MSMNGTRVLGLAALGAFLSLAAPTAPAQALSLINPGAATAVQDGSKEMMTEVRYHHHHHYHHHYHHRWHHRY